jgi:molybdopterin/thiamine biosynthesis adenylyltransferase
MAKRRNITQRHEDVISIPVLESTPIHIIGGGSIGSFTALSLAKMGARDITIWDGDTVELHNIGNQFFKLDDVGQLKTKALTSLVQDMSGTKIKSHARYWKEKDIKDLKGIVIMALDNMFVRKQVWEACKNNKNVKRVIDLRMGLETLNVIVVDPNKADEQQIYAENWYPDGETEEARCSQKTIIYTVNFGAGIICNRVKQIINNEFYPKYLALDIKTLEKVALGEENDIQD